MLVNCRSIKNKVDIFDDLVRMTKPSVVIGTESWLNEDVANTEVFPDNFTCYRKDRNYHGGGVFILVDQRIPSIGISTTDDTSEAVWCQLKLSNGKSLSVCSFYRPPTGSTKEFSEFTATATKIASDYVVVGGDFNLPDLDWNEQPIASGSSLSFKSEMADFMNLLSLKQTVLKPTRGGHILDLFFTNMPEMVENTEVLPGISDHEVVLSEINMKHTSAYSERSRCMYNYAKANVQGINTALEAYFIVFETLADDYSVEELWNLFKDKILELRNRFVPTWVLTRRRNKSKPWFCRELDVLVKRRQRIYRSFKRNPSEENSCKLKLATREVNNATVEMKVAYFKTIERKITQNPKELWRYIKRNKKDNISIPALTSGDITVSDTTEKAKLFNLYFTSVFSAATDPQKDLKLLVHESTSMPDVVLDARGIELLLRDLDCAKAVGPDCLPNFMLKSSSHAVSMYLKVIFEKSLKQSSLPTDWKMASVAPIHKSGPRNAVNNYRPISLTSVCSKILEHILYTAIVKHIDSNSLFNSNQHGFRQGLSCVTQLVEFTHVLAAALDDKFSVDCIFLDFQKAFDTVSHFLLLKKLTSFNINHQVIAWIAEYLHERRQYVVVNGEQSEITSVTSGVPQGSVLGPLLFLLYINDINENVQSHIRLFADDCILYRQITSETDCSVIQNDLCAIYAWCQRWEMKLNLKKTVCMRFSRKRNPGEFEYTINSSPVKMVRVYKYLGVFFCPSLSWNRHVDYTVNKACRSLGFLKRNTRAFPQQTREVLYKTYVRSVLEYACCVWDPATSSNKERLEKVQSMAARYVFNAPMYDRQFSATEAKLKLKWKSLQHRRASFRLKLLHSIFYSHTRIPCDVYISRPHYISARKDHEHKIREYKCNTSSFSNSFFPRTISQWNRLPPTIVEISSTDAFFSAIKMIESLDR